MSGGHFNHIQYRVEEGLNEFGRCDEVKERWPKLAKTLRSLSDGVGEVLHDIDWDLSGDSTVSHDFEAESIRKLLEVFDEHSS